MAIKFKTNNQGVLHFEQPTPDGAVTVKRFSPLPNQRPCTRTGKPKYSTDYEITISPADFVTMLNWYQYQKNNGNENLSF